ncbi:MAG: hypothetical protein AAF573_01270, partial [Bacteroidota bacterium]
FKDILRFLNETNPEIIQATENDIRQHIPKDIPRLLTIDKFNHLSAYDEEILPSQHETYQMIAKVLVTKKLDYWSPTLPFNNHWSNWESGNL